MTSTRSVEDVVDAADGWHLFGTECPKEEIVFFCQVIICTRSLWSAYTTRLPDTATLPFGLLY